MKKILTVLIAVIALILVLSPVAVLAGAPTTPNYGVVDPLKLWNPPPPWFSDVLKVIPNPNAPGGQIRIVTDNLAPTPAGGDASGTIVFPCQSTVGFKYNIVVTGLDPLTRYSVEAVGAKVLQLVDEGTPGAIPLEPGVWALPIVPELLDLNLGGFMADANGLGGVKGAIKLEAPFIYEVSVEVFDASETQVLGPALEGGLPDTTGFMVY